MRLLSLLASAILLAAFAWEHGQSISAQAQLTRLETALSSTQARLDRLKSATARLEASASQAVTPGHASSIDPGSLDLLRKAIALRTWVYGRPDRRIPEFDYAWDSDWFDAVSGVGDLADGREMAKAYASVASKAKFHSSQLLRLALLKYADQHNGVLPQTVGELATTFPDPHAGPAFFERYEMVAAGKLADASKDTDLVRERLLPDAEHLPLAFGASGIVHNQSAAPFLLGALAANSVSFELNEGEDLFALASGPALVRTVDAYQKAHNGAMPSSYAALAPYAADADAARRIARLQEIEATAKPGPP